MTKLKLYQSKLQNSNTSYILIKEQGFIHNRLKLRVITELFKGEKINEAK